MPRPLFDSPYIFGLHDPGGEAIMAEAGRRGWIVFTEAVGTNPNDFTGRDYTPWASQDFGIICRINNGYGSVGTIPDSSQYDNFAKRVGNFVAASSGCKIWVIGNEMNFSQEWPLKPGAKVAAAAAVDEPVERGPNADPLGRSSPDRFSAIHHSMQESIGATSTKADPRASAFEMITPDLYARCFRLCRDAIKTKSGHGDDQVITGAVAPWNDQAKYATNPTGDWVKYLQDMLSLLGVGGFDGIALHTYTHGSDPALILSTATMNAPFQNRYYNFLAYQNFMAAIPTEMRKLPVYITETDQDVAWLDANNGWVQAAYAEIDRWNKTTGNQQIRALVLYRWPPLDRWYIEGKAGVIAAFRDALRNDYQWKPPLPPPANWKAGDIVRALQEIKMRDTAGGVPIATIARGTRLTLLNGTPKTTPNGLVYWYARNTLSTGYQDGWVAQFSTAATPLLALVPPPDPLPFNVGDQVQTQTIVRMRKTPGTTNKPASDIVADVPAETVLTVMSGPTSADQMRWWYNSGTIGAANVAGWQAEALPDGTQLLAKYVPPTEPPAIILPPTFEAGDRFKTTTIVRLRKTPGTANKPASDIVQETPANTEGKIVGGPQRVEDLTWWNVNVPSSNGQMVTGWMAESLADGTTLMTKLYDGEKTVFEPGDLAVVSDFANIRKTPGTTNKPADDVIGMFAPEAVVTILSGPQVQDGITWWRVGGITSTGVEGRGNVAQEAPGKIRLLARAEKLPGTDIPNKERNVYLAAPFDGAYGIAQLWGENPAYYSQFNYDGVALLGHNGIDFLTPTGTLIYAVDGGTVAKAGYEPGGFGNYILLSHPWGESIYGHLDSIAVTEGQVVGRGQYIGKSGATGGATGPHLHSAIRVNPYVRSDGWGGFTDPLPYLPPESFVLPGYVLDPPAAPAITAAFAGPRETGITRDQPSSMGDSDGEERP